MFFPSFIFFLFAFVLGSNIIKKDVLSFGDGSEYTPHDLKSLISIALVSIRLDPFCTAMMDVIKCHDDAAEEYYDFIFNGYEQSCQHFYPNKVESWDFLLNQSFIQFLERKVEQDSIEGVEEIIKRFIIPKYPILKEINYEFDIKAFVEGDIVLRGDMTGHFEDVQTFYFFLQLKNVIYTADIDETQAKIQLYNLLSTAESILRSETKPYIDFLMKVPIKVMKTIYFPLNDFSTDFEHSIKKFVIKRVYFDLYKKSPEILEDVMKSLTQNSNEMKYFKFLMKFYEIYGFYEFIITNPLEFHLLEATKNQNYEQIKVLKESLNLLKRECIDNVFDLVLETDDSKAIDLLLDQRYLDNYNLIGVNLFESAVEKDKRNIIDSFLQGRVNRPSPEMIGDSMIKLFNSGNLEHLVYIAEELYRPGLNTKNLKEILYLSVEAKHEELVERILVNESKNDALIFKEDMQFIYANALYQCKDFDILRLFLRNKELIKRLEFKDFVLETFKQALNVQNFDLTVLYLDCDSIEQDQITNLHLEAIEKEDEDEINLFERFTSNKNK